MHFMRNIQNRIFYYSLDAYFIYVTYSESLSDIEGALPPGYSVRSIDINNTDEKRALIDLWVIAYYTPHEQSADRALGDIAKLKQSNNTCFGLFFGTKLIGMQWVGYEDAINTLDFASILKDRSNSAILHHVFILPDHRGKKLQTLLMLAGKQAAKSLGRAAIFTFVGVRNFASVRNMMKCSDRYQLIYHLKIDLPFCTFNIFPGSDITSLQAPEKNTRTDRSRGS